MAENPNAAEIAPLEVVVSKTSFPWQLLGAHCLLKMEVEIRVLWTSSAQRLKNSRNSES